MNDLGAAIDWYESMKNGTELKIDTDIQIRNLVENDGISEQNAIIAIFRDKHEET